jgi:hypothetical protein
MLELETWMVALVVVRMNQMRILEEYLVLVLA